MKFSGLLTALGVLVVLGGLVWWTNKHPQTDTKKTETPKLINAKRDDFQQITMTKAGSDPVELNLLAGNWEIVKPTPYHADQDAVTMLEGTMLTITTDRLVDDHPTNLDQFGLSMPTFQLETKTKDGKTTKILFGSDNPEEIANLISLVIADDVLRHKLAATGRLVCRKEFSNELAGPKLEDLYLKIAS